MTQQWYVVQAHSSSEKTVQKSLLERIDRAGLKAQFEEILVPTVDVVELKGGQKVVTEQKIFPGYVLIRMEMTDESWHLVKNTPKVSGFLGGKSNKPTPISQREVDHILKKIQVGAETPQPKILFETGEMVRIKEGAFIDFQGVVESINYEKSKLRVDVTIFGRATPVELDFIQVEKT